MLLPKHDVESRLSRNIMPGDHMYFEANPAHYFSVGSSALHCVEAAAIAARREAFAEMLDFACGSGRVARWLRAAFPGARLSVSDLRKDSLEWLSANLGAEPWLSSDDIGALTPPRAFDLVWCGSLITHLPENASRATFQAFARWLAPGGIAVVSTHGRKVLHNQRAGRNRYLPKELFEPLAAAYEATGYGYADYPGRSGIGLSLCSPLWLARTICGIEGMRLVGITESAWDGHHDVVAFQRVA